MKLTDDEANNLQKEIEHILDSGVNSIRLLNMFDKFLENRHITYPKEIEQYKKDMLISYKLGFKACVDAANGAYDSIKDK